MPKWQGTTMRYNYSFILHFCYYEWVWVYFRVFWSHLWFFLCEPSNSVFCRFSVGFYILLICWNYLYIKGIGFLLGFKLWNVFFVGVYLLTLFFVFLSCRKFQFLSNQILQSSSNPSPLMIKHQTNPNWGAFSKITECFSKLSRSPKT